jgi:NAD-specific glutamate dehydrogenase
LSYGKIWLYRALIHSNVPEDPYLSTELTRYFPTPVQKALRARLKRHRLRREIIATAITNSLINRMGPVFPVRAQDDTGADPAAIARAYSIAREVFAARDIWTQNRGARQPHTGGRAVHGHVSNHAPAAAHELLAARESARRSGHRARRAALRPQGGEAVPRTHRRLGVTEQARLRVLRSQLIEQHVPEISPRASPRWRRCIARWTWWRSPPPRASTSAMRPRPISISASASA